MSVPPVRTCTPYGGRVHLGGPVRRTLPPEGGRAYRPAQLVDIAPVATCALVRVPIAKQARVSALVILTPEELRKLIREEVQAAVGGQPRAPGYLDAQTAAHRIGVTAKTVMRWARRGNIRGTKVGRKWQFREADIRDVLENGKIGDRDG